MKNGEDGGGGGRVFGRSGRSRWVGVLGTTGDEDVSEGDGGVEEVGDEC